MKRVELILNEDLLKELQQIATGKGISLEVAANKVLESYANLVKSTNLAVERSKIRYS